MCDSELKTRQVQYNNLHYSCLHVLLPLFPRTRVHFHHPSLRRLLVPTPHVTTLPTKTTLVLLSLHLKLLFHLLLQNNLTLKCTKNMVINPALLLPPTVSLITPSYSEITPGLSAAGPRRLSTSCMARLAPGHLPDIIRQTNAEILAEVPRRPVPVLLSLRPNSSREDIFNDSGGVSLSETDTSSFLSGSMLDDEQIESLTLQMGDYHRFLEAMDSNESASKV